MNSDAAFVVTLNPGVAVSTHASSAPLIRVHVTIDDGLLTPAISRDALVTPAISRDALETSVISRDALITPLNRDDAV